jgi:hypothetical protein
LTRTEEELKGLAETGLVPDKKAHLVFHYTHAAAAALTQKMVHKSYELLSEHVKVFSTVVLMDPHVRGTAANINCQSSCPKLAETIRNAEGYKVDILTVGTKPRDLLPGHEKIFFKDSFQEVDIHIFADNADQSPATITHRDQGTWVPNGVCRQLIAYYDEKNVTVKKCITDYANEKTIKVNFMQDDSASTGNSPEVKGRSPRKSNLSFGRYRRAVITVITGATHTIISSLKEAGAYVGPMSTTNARYFELRSKKMLPFPDRELAELSRAFQMMDIINRGHFRFYLYGHQRFDDVPKMLGLAKATEVNSFSLTANPSSPWVELAIDGHAILINKEYRQDNLHATNTVYIGGFDSIFDAQYVESLLHKATNTVITVVDDEKETQGSACFTARFLQNIYAFQKPAHLQYMLGLSSANEENLTTLKQAVRLLSGFMNGKYYTADTLVSKLSVVAPIQSRKRAAEEEKSAKDHQSFQQVPVSSKKNSNPTPDKRSGKVNQPQATPAANSYSQFIEVDEEDNEDTSQLPAREPELGDFDITGDTIIKNWLRDKIGHLDIDGEQMKKLHLATVKYVVSSSENYHNGSNPGLPTWFTKTGKTKGGRKGASTRPGLGSLLLAYASLPKLSSEDIDTAIEIIEEASKKDRLDKHDFVAEKFRAATAQRKTVPVVKKGSTIVKNNTSTKAGSPPSPRNNRGDSLKVSPPPSPISKAGTGKQNKRPAESPTKVFQQAGATKHLKPGQDSESADEKMDTLDGHNGVATGATQSS